MYRTAGPRTLDEDKMYLAEFIAEDAGKVQMIYLQKNKLNLLKEQKMR